MELEESPRPSNATNEPRCSLRTGRTADETFSSMANVLDIDGAV